MGAEVGMGRLKRHITLEFLSSCSVSKEAVRVMTFTLNLQSYLLRRCLKWVPGGSSHTGGTTGALGPRDTSIDGEFALRPTQNRKTRPPWTSGD